MNKHSVSELALRTVEALLARGITPTTAWHEYGRVHLPIIRTHKERDKEEFDREIVTEFVRMVGSRFERGEISLGYYRSLKRGAQHLTEMYDTGKLEWSAPKKVSGFILNKYFEKILVQFVSSAEVSPKAKSDLMWVGRKYFFWLIQEGHLNLKKVGADEVQRFMIYCSNHMKSSGLHNVKIYLRKLYRYLSDNGHSTGNFDGLLSFPVSRESRMFPALPQDEIALILEMIDKCTPKGKRDYAMVLLGVVTGLRAIDIARLKLTDIDWINGEIKIVQSKTERSLALPLTRDVGEAVRDYILKGRQQTTSDAVFLRIHPPFQAFSNGVAIEDMFDYYRKRAGLPRDAYDGKGFHALRRSLGKSMITAGVPVTTVAQVFGDGDTDSVTKYIALDSEHLKECALDFTGIEPEGGAEL